MSVSPVVLVMILCLAWPGQADDTESEEIEESHLLLHPSLTSSNFLDSNTIRKAKKTNFKALKEALLRSIYG